LHAQNINTGKCILKAERRYGFIHEEWMCVLRTQVSNLHKSPESGGWSIRQVSLDTDKRGRVNKEIVMTEVCCWPWNCKYQRWYQFISFHNMHHVL